MSLIIANAIWPAIYLVAQSASLWPVVLSIIIEYFVLRYISTLSWHKALLYVVAVNGFSALIGALPLVILDLGKDFLLGTLSEWLFGFRPGTFSVASWTATTLLASLISTSFEYLLLKPVLKVPFKFRHPWLIWWIANLLTAAIATIVLQCFPMDLDG